MNVVPLGPEAAPSVLAALRRNEIVCLLCDRDIQGGGVEVNFFGEKTTLPAGPAMLGLRADAVVLPTAVYFTMPAETPACELRQAVSLLKSDLAIQRAERESRTLGSIARARCSRSKR